MPPRAIASPVRTAISSAASEPVLAWWRSRYSITMAGGNFGAPPKPPCRSSNSRLSPTSASCNSASPGGVCTPLPTA